MAKGEFTSYPVGHPYYGLTREEIQERVAAKNKQLQQDGAPLDFTSPEFEQDYFNQIEKNIEQSQADVKTLYEVEVRSALEEQGFKGEELDRRTSRFVFDFGSKVDDKLEGFVMGKLDAAFDNTYKLRYKYLRFIEGKSEEEAAEIVAGKVPEGVDPVKSLNFYLDGIEDVEQTTVDKISTQVNIKNQDLIAQNIFQSYQQQSSEFKNGVDEMLTNGEIDVDKRNELINAFDNDMALRYKGLLVKYAGTETAETLIRTNPELFGLVGDEETTSFEAAEQIKEPYYRELKELVDQGGFDGLEAANVLKTESNESREYYENNIGPIADNFVDQSRTSIFLDALSDALQNFRLGIKTDLLMIGAVADRVTEGEEFLDQNREKYEEAVDNILAEYAYYQAEGITDNRAHMPVFDFDDDKTIFQAMADAEYKNLAHGLGQGIGFVLPILATSGGFNLASGLARMGGRTTLASGLRMTGLVSTMGVSQIMMSVPTLKDAMDNGLDVYDAFKYSGGVSTVVGVSDALIFNQIIGKPLARGFSALSNKITTSSLKSLGGRTFQQAGLKEVLLNSTKVTRELAGRTTFKHFLQYGKRFGVGFLQGALLEGPTEFGQYYIELAGQEIMSGNQSAMERKITQKVYENLQSTMPDKAKAFKKSRGRFMFMGPEFNLERGLTEGLYGSIIGGLLGGSTRTVLPVHEESLAALGIDALNRGDEAFLDKIRNQAKISLEKGKINQGIYDNIVENLQFIEANKSLFKGMSDRNGMRQIIKLEQFKESLLGFLKDPNTDNNAIIEIDGNKKSVLEAFTDMISGIEATQMKIRAGNKSIQSKKFAGFVNLTRGEQDAQSMVFGNMSFTEASVALHNAIRKLDIKDVDFYSLKNAMDIGNIPSLVNIHKKLHALQRKRKKGVALFEEEKRLYEEYTDLSGMTEAERTSLNQAAADHYMYNYIVKHRNSNWRSLSKAEQDRLMGQNDRMQSKMSDAQIDRMNELEQYNSLLEKLHNGEASSKEFKKLMTILMSEKGYSKEKAESILRGQDKAVNQTIDFVTFETFNPGFKSTPEAVQDFTSSAFRLAQEYNITADRLKNAGIEPESGKKYSLSQIEEFIENNPNLERQRQRRKRRQTEKVAREKAKGRTEQAKRAATVSAIQRAAMKQYKGPLSGVSQEILDKLEREIENNSKQSRLGMSDKLSSDAQFKEFLINRLAEILPEVEVNFVSELVNKYGVRALGMAIGNSVYLSEDAVQDTIIHEYLEIYYDFLKEYYPELSERAKKSLMKTDLFNKIQQKYPSYSLDGQIKETFITMASMNSLQSLRQEFGEGKLSMFENIKQLIKDIMRSIREFLGTSTYQDLAVRLSEDFLSTSSLELKGVLKGPEYQMASTRPRDITRQTLFKKITEFVMNNQLASEFDIEVFKSEVEAFTLLSLQEFLSDEQNAQTYSKQKLIDRVKKMGLAQGRTDQQLEETDSAVLLFDTMKPNLDKGLDAFSKNTQKFTIELVQELNEIKNRVRSEDIQEPSTSLKFILNNLFDNNFNSINEGDAFTYAAMYAGVSKNLDEFLDSLTNITGDSQFTKTAAAIRVLFNSLNDNTKNQLFAELASFAFRNHSSFVVKLGEPDSAPSMVMNDMSNNANILSSSFITEMSTRIASIDEAITEHLYKNFDEEAYNTNDGYKNGVIRTFSEVFQEIGMHEFTPEAIANTEFSQDSKKMLSLWFLLKNSVYGDLRTSQDVKKYLKGQRSIIRSLVSDMQTISKTSNFVSLDGKRTPAVEYGSWNHEVLRNFDELYEMWSKNEFYRDNPILKKMKKFKDKNGKKAFMEQYFDYTHQVKSGDRVIDLNNLTPETIVTQNFLQFLMATNYENGYNQWIGPMGSRGRFLTVKADYIPKKDRARLIDKYGKTKFGKKLKLTEAKKREVLKAIQSSEIDFTSYLKGKTLKAAVDAFVDIDFINRRAAQDIFSYGDLEAFNNYFDAYKRSDAAESTGAKVFFPEGKKIHFVFLDELSKDLSEELGIPEAVVRDAADSFSLMNDNLNNHIINQSPGYRKLGINQKPMMYQRGEDGKLFYYKTSTVVPGKVDDKYYQQKAEVMKKIEERVTKQTGDTNPFVIISEKSAMKGDKSFMNDATIDDSGNSKSIHSVTPFNFRIQQAVSKTTAEKQSKLSVQLLSNVLSFADVKTRNSILKDLTELLDAQLENELELVGGTKGLLRRALNATTTELTDIQQEIATILIEEGYDNIDHKDLTNQVQSILLKTLTSAGLRLSLPGSELHMIPDYAPVDSEEHLTYKIEDGNLKVEVKVPEDMGLEIGDQVVSVRVPASGPFSTFTGIVKGFTPAGTNMIMNPSAYVWTSNADFDVDKLFTFRLNKGRLNNKQRKQNRLLRNIMDVMQSDEYFTDSKRELDVASITQAVVDGGYDLRETFDGASILDQAKLWKQATEAEKIIGIFASVSRVYDYLVQSDIAPKESIKVGKFELSEFNQNSKDRKFELAEFLQLALDDLKSMVQSSTGITQHNAFVAAQMMMMGMGKKDIIEFFNKPNIKRTFEYVDKVLNDPFVENKYVGFTRQEIFTQSILDANNVDLEVGLSAKILIESELSGIDDDLAALIDLNDMANELSPIYRLIGLVTSNIGNTVYDFNSKYNEITDIKDGKYFSKEDIEKMTTRLDMQQHRRLMDTISTRFLSKHFALGNQIVYGKLEKIFGQFGVERGFEQLKRVVEVTKLKNFTYKNPSEFARRFAEMSESMKYTFIGNEFIDRLRIQEDETTNEVFIAFDNNGLDNSDSRTRVRDAFKALPKVYQQMFEDYAVLTNNLNTTMFNYYHVLPEAFHKKHLKVLNDNLGKSLAKNDNLFDIVERINVAENILNSRKFKEEQGQKIIETKPQRETQTEVFFRPSKKTRDIGGETITDEYHPKFRLYNNVLYQKTQEKGTPKIMSYKPVLRNVNDIFSEYAGRQFLNVSLKGKQISSPANPLKIVNVNNQTLTYNSPDGKVTVPYRTEMFVSTEGLRLLRENSALEYAGLAIVRKGDNNFLVELENGDILTNLKSLDAITEQEVLESFLSLYQADENFRSKVEENNAERGKKYNEMVKRDEKERFGTVLGFYSDNNVSRGIIYTAKDRKVQSQIEKKMKELYPDIVVFNKRPGGIPKGPRGAAYITDLNGALVRGVDWSVNSGNLDIAPHEYGHHYVDMFRNDSVIQEGIRKFGEEGLVDRLGKAHLRRYQNSSFVNLINRIWNRIRSYLGHPDIIATLEENFNKGVAPTGVAAIKATNSKFVGAYEGDKRINETKDYARDKNSTFNVELLLDSMSEQQAEVIRPFLSDLSGGLEINERKVGEQFVPNEANRFAAAKIKKILDEAPQGVTPARILSEMLFHKGKNLGIIDKAKKQVEGIGRVSFGPTQQHIVAPQDLEILEETLRVKVGEENQILNEVAEMMLQEGRTIEEPSAEAIKIYNQLVRLIAAQQYRGTAANSLFLDLNGKRRTDLDFYTEQVMAEFLNKEDYVKGIREAFKELLAGDFSNISRATFEALNKLLSIPSALLMGQGDMAKLDLVMMSLLRQDVLVMGRTGRHNGFAREIFYEQFNTAQDKYETIKRDLDLVFDGKDGLFNFLSRNANKISLRYINDPKLREEAAQRLAKNTIRFALGKTANLTDMEVVSLYMLTRNPKIRKQMLEGNQTVSFEEKRKSGTIDGNFQLDSQTITDIENIVENNADYQKLTAGFNRAISLQYDIMNPIYKALHGVDMVKEEGFFPIFRMEDDKAVVPKDEAKRKRIFAPSFTNPRFDLANKNLKIGDALEEFQKLKNRVASYGAFAIPAFNLNQIVESIASKYESTDIDLQNRAKSQKGKTGRFSKGLLNDPFMAFQQIFLDQLNDKFMRNADTDLFNESSQVFRTLMGAFTVKALSSFGVPVKQTMSYSLISPVIDPKYAYGTKELGFSFLPDIAQAIGLVGTGVVNNILNLAIKAFSPNFDLPTIPRSLGIKGTELFFNNVNEIIQYSQLGRTRFLGGKIDVYLSEAFKGLEPGQKERNFLRTKGLGRIPVAAYNALVNFTGDKNPVMNAILLMDAATVQAIWGAAKRQVQGETDLKEGSQQYWNAVTQLFEKTIRKTQPIYDFVNRPAANRGGKSIFGEMTALVHSTMIFSTQRNQIVNMIAEAYLRKKHKIGPDYNRFALKTAGSVFANTAGITWVNLFGVNSLRNNYYKLFGLDDEDDLELEEDTNLLLEFMRNFLANNPLYTGANSLKIVEGIFKKFGAKTSKKQQQYFSSEIPLYQAYNELIRISKQMSGQKYDEMSDSDRRALNAKLTETILMFAPVMLGGPNVQRAFDRLGLQRLKGVGYNELLTRPLERVSKFEQDKRTGGFQEETIQKEQIQEEEFQR